MTIGNITSWWNETWKNYWMVKWHADKMSFWWNVILVKCHGDEMSFWWNGMLIKCHFDEMAWWWNVILMKWHPDEMACWWKWNFDEMTCRLNDRLMTYRWNEHLLRLSLDKMTNYQNDKLTKWPVDEMPIAECHKTFNFSLCRQKQQGIKFTTTQFLANLLMSQIW